MKDHTHPRPAAGSPVDCEVGRLEPERANACKLTEYQGRPRCDMCKAMDLHVRGGWRPMWEAPKEEGPVLLLVPTRFAKRATHIQAQGEWFGNYWVILNADEALQRVEPEGWRPLHPYPASKTPNAPVTG